MRYVLVLFLLYLSGCSSSSSGPVLPDQIEDRSAPEIILITPTNDEDPAILPTDSVFVIQFDELVDEASVLESVRIKAIKDDDIFSSTVEVPTDTDAVPVSLERPISISIDEPTIRLPRSNTQQKPDDIVRGSELERNVTQLTISPTNSLPLASTLFVSINSELKDRSQVNSVHPITQLPTTGNFMAGFGFLFQTEDGAWGQEASLLDNPLPDSNGSQPRFLAGDSMGLGSWLNIQTLAGGGTQQTINAREFNNLLQTFQGAVITVGAGEMTLGDFLPVANNVQLYANATDSLRNCFTWVNRLDAPSNQFGLFAQCYTTSGAASPALEIMRFADSAVLMELDILALESGEFVVLSLIDNDMELHELRIDSNNTLQSSISQAVTGTVYGVHAAVVNRESSENTVSLLSHVLDPSSTAPNLRYQLTSIDFRRSNTGFDLVAQRNITTADNPIGDYSFSYDRLGFAYAIWTEPEGVERVLYSSRFGGIDWAPKTRRATVTGISPSLPRLSVTTEGDALIAWAENNELYAQGLFITPAGVVRTNPELVASSFGAVKASSLVHDLEGNASLAYLDNANRLSAVRFLHNREWRESWTRSEVVGLGVKGSNFQITSMSVDGRLISVFVKEDGVVSAPFANVFSDYH